MGAPFKNQTVRIYADNLFDGKVINLTGIEDSNQPFQVEQALA